MAGVRRGGWRWVLASVGALVVFLGIQVMMGFAASFVVSLQLVATMPGVMTDDPQAVFDALTPAMLVVSQLACLAVGAPWWRRVSRRLRRPSRASAGHAVALLCSLLVLSVAFQLVISAGLTFLLPLAPALQQNYSEAMQGISGTSALTVVSVVVMAPIVEEAFFRGVALTYARRGLVSAAAANVLQATLFGIAHGNIVQGAYAFCLGLVLGLVRLRYRRLWPCMILHLGMNASSYLIDAVSTLPERPFLVVMIVGAVASVVVLALGLRRLVRGLPADGESEEIPALPPSPYAPPSGTRPPRPSGL